MVDLNACDYCEHTPGAVHQDWHPTRGQMLEIGHEMAKRAQSKERWEIVHLPDPLLAAYLGRLQRMYAAADEDELPDILRDLLAESIGIAQKEWDWRHRAARRGGPAVVRDGQWRDRIETVRQDADLAMLIAYECANARPMGPGKWEASCPFHADPGPSLSINVAKRVWHCFGCLKGGDAFNYVMERYGLTFSEAVVHLEQRLGIVPRTPSMAGVEVPRL